MSYFTREDILQASENGLKIFLMLLPQINPSKPKDKFKLRPGEKTESASLFQSKKDGEWRLKDFGSADKAMRSIEFFMQEKGLEFGEAMHELGKALGISASGEYNLRSAEYEELPATEQTEGFSYEINENPEALEKAVEYLGPYVTPELCESGPIKVKLLSHYIIHKEDKAHKLSSTPDYPIFLFDYGQFQKIYQPFAKKKYRFIYIGKRPKDFIAGLQALKDSKEKTYIDYKRLDTSIAKKKMAILCSGETDALNVAGLGYNVLWMNSETQVMTWAQYKEVTSLVHDLYYLGDIDATGLNQSFEYGMKFIDIKIIRLPEELKQRKDKRGNPCKDAKDYLTHYTEYQFNQLISTAYPFCFWDYKIKRDKESNEITEVRYQFNPIHCINFLEWNGFFKIKSQSSKTGYIFIQKKNHIIKEVDHPTIRGFVNDFVRDRKFNTDIINLVLKTNQLSENALSNIREIEIDFSKAGKEFQLFFFEKQVWKITKDEISMQTPDQFDRFVWNDQIIQSYNDHQPKIEILDDFFTVTKDSMGDYNIEIHNQSNPYFQFLINTSRMFWKEEFQNAGEDPYQPNSELVKKELHRIDGKHLDAEKIKDQKRHLINKLYAIGYMLHNFKNPSRSWMPFAVDHNISDVTESHGGSGKSIIFDTLKLFLKTVKLNGRNSKLMENNHAFENVTLHTDFVFFDDCKNGFDIGFLFPFITGEMDVNPKHAKSFSIAFEDSPKLACTSNFAPRNLDSSTERRLLYVVNSDFYHYRSDRNPNSKTPQDDFGIILLQEFKREQWNEFFNLMAQCVKLYLNFPKIEPPMDNVEKRNLRSFMGDNFFHWAEGYFIEKVNLKDAPDSHSDVFVPILDAKDDFIKNGGHKNLSTNLFNKKTEGWCKYHGLIFNHPDLRSSDGRIMKHQEGKTVQMYHFMKSRKDLTEDEQYMADLNSKHKDSPF